MFKKPKYIAADAKRCALRTEFDGNRASILDTAFMSLSHFKDKK